jgi:NTP pyrophosphatase (non-canonical NTP hydrolase)
MDHFNGLTPAEAERLAILLEELGEAQQAIGKILRHGYESTHPSGGPTNRESLERELGDVRYSMISLCDSGDLSKDEIRAQARIKSKKVKQYLHHQ